MSASGILDWTTLRLDGDGRSLVEASAGTGKTWTIAALYLRLLLEGQAPPRPTQIIVSTFTRAAAAELSDRLRARLLQALAWAADRSLAEAGDPALDWLTGRWRGPEGDRLRARDGLRLREALAELDRAPILTLHGLCQRVLAEYPFEAGSALRADALVDGQALIDEVADDLWRWLHQSDAGALPEPLRGYTLPRPTLRGWLRTALSAGVDLSRAALPVLDLAEHARRIAPYRALLGLVEAGQPAPERPWLKKGGAPGLDAALDALPALLSARPPSLGQVERVLAGLEFDPAQAVKRRPQPPAGIDEALASLAPLAAELRGYLDAVRAWLLAEGRRRLERLLETRQQSTFDALVERVHAALAGPDGARAQRLADALHAAFPVALVDEFQDTDGLQYGILDRIYRDAQGRPRGRLVLIGDPKQAIYRFRGGDIEAYLRARADVLDGGGERLSLTVNHRSSWHYVAALNALYAACDQAMEAAAFEPETSAAERARIVYEPVRAAAGEEGPGLFERLPDGRLERVVEPLALYLDADGSGVRGRALRACAAQIAALLAEAAAGRWWIGTPSGLRAIQAGDIAVLLPSHADIRRLQGLLIARGVPCVASRRSSVLAAPIARDLLLVLEAAHAPACLPLLRAALMTAFWGLSPQALAALGDDAGAWSAHLARFAGYQALWQRRGVLGLVLELAADCAPALRAAGYGDRELADLRHLGELLSAQARRLSGPEALLDWLAHELDAPGEADEVASEERQLRLDSEADHVQLMTLHASKGLEFPVVWLPTLFALQPRGASRQALHLLRPATGGERRVPGFGPAAAEQAWRESADECYRLIYVALTRARLACRVFGLRAAESLPSRKATAGTPLQRMLGRVLERTPAPKALAVVAGWFSASSAGRVDLRAAADPHACAVAARPLPQPRPARMLHSFTQLTRQIDRAGIQTEAAADDETEVSVSLPGDVAADGGPHPGLAALAPWRGAAFGNALHAIFEQRDPDRPLAEQLDLVLDCLARERLRPGPPAPAAFAAALAARLQAALDTPLGLASAPSLRLSSLPASAQRAELAFDFVVEQRPLQFLNEVLQAHGLPALGLAGGFRLDGLFTGKIDLVFGHQGRFHVLDYKSNWLGPTLADYRGQALAQQMDAVHYRLQALLYAVATRRYLRQRLGSAWHEDRLGECVYLFVRAAGLDPAVPDAGIWRQRFAPELLDAVDRALAGPAAVELP